MKFETKTVPNPADILYESTFYLIRKTLQ